MLLPSSSVTEYLKNRSDYITTRQNMHDKIMIKWQKLIKYLSELQSVCKNIKPEA